MAYYDDLETQDPVERERQLFSSLREHVSRAQTASPHYANTLAGVDPTALNDRTALAKLPVLYKSDLIALQTTQQPFAGLSALVPGQMRRVFLSPGPIAEVQAHGGADHWRMARALYAAGIRTGDVILNAFAYHVTPAGFMFDEAAAAIGCAVFPGGVGNTDTQVQAIRHFRINAYTGTPDFLKIIIEKADSVGTPIPSISKALVTGGPLFPQLRVWYGERGVSVRQCYGTAELGLIAYEGAGPQDGMVIAENCIVEIVRPGTGELVQDGEVGEVVVTTFDDSYPLIRLATGDLSAIMPGQSPCGRTNRRLKGWMGRADQATKVKGMFVRPEQIAEVGRRHPGLGRMRLVVTRDGDTDSMALIVESASRDEGLAARLAETLQDVTKLRGTVSFSEPGTLPNDGKVIVDERKFD